jgi:hypothetical protein
MRPVFCTVVASALIGSTTASAAPPGYREPSNPPPPQAVKVWTKAGASDEEYWRTRAACGLRMYEAQNINPDGPYEAIFASCMQANGWVYTGRPQ